MRIDLSDKMQEALNKQIAEEGYASNFYLALAYWCDNKALEGCKRFFLRQSEEERMHMLKLYEYLSVSDVHPITPGFNQPPADFKSIQEVFSKVLDQERSVTASIHSILKLAKDENDFNTQQFLQWYVDEQREEEAVIRTILDRIRIIGEGGQSLYYIDKEVEKVNTGIINSESTEA
ncbi:MAG: ferritin [Chitinophagales bacterium]|nr:ferritin [Chitinophagales bacterium]